MKGDDMFINTQTITYNTSIECIMNEKRYVEHKADDTFWILINT